MDKKLDSPIPNQLNLFAQKEACCYCKKAIPPDPDNLTLLWGFRDGVTNEVVCWNCQFEHYRTKDKN